MGFFGSIFKGVSNAVRGVGRAARKSLPSVLSIAKGFIPGGNLIGGVVEGIIGGGGKEESFTGAIQKAAKEASGYSYPSSSGKSAGMAALKTGTEKVVIYD